jgi:two-component system, chemotaxis family, chemotaxis protein CheY
MTYRILVADDAKFIRDMLIEVLSNHALTTEIYEAENGAEAIEAYKKFKPDLVFMDVNMPKVDGMEALHSILRFDLNAKIIMISGIEQKYMMHQAVRQGAKDFVMKPFSESIVVEVVTRVLDSK